MPFLSEPEPVRGIATPVMPGIRRIVAANANLMTYHGTNTYLIDGAGGTIVLDPGPDDSNHVDDILKATGAKVSLILLTHAHSDHFGAVAALKAATGAPAHAFHKSGDPAFSPDVPLADGDVVAGMTAIHTPGHAADHLCFARPDGIVFTGDHVMTWSSSIVSPPGGDMADYLASLSKMFHRDDRLYLPGHGPPMAEPRRYVQELIEARVEREAAIASSLRSSPMNVADIARLLYDKKHPWLQRAAERNVMSHLIKLREEGRVEERCDVWTLRG